jgi:predicted alpha/beta superfamily hydrolase
MKDYIIDKYIFHIVQNKEIQMESPVVYVHAEKDETQTISDMISTACTIVGMEGADWDNELSPWPMQKVFKNGKDFGGKANGYLSKLTDNYIPEIENRLKIKPSQRTIAGYSLAGLFAVYSLFVTDLFDGVVCASGSLWYKEFIERMKNTEKIHIPKKIYFSLGDSESHTKNQVLATVLDCTIKTRDYFREKGSETILEMNQGNHFIDSEIRTSRGIQWILGERNNWRGVL